MSRMRVLRVDLPTGLPVGNPSKPEGEFYGEITEGIAVSEVISTRQNERTGFSASNPKGYSRHLEEVFSVIVQTLDPLDPSAHPPLDG